jgi:hypothetical protein
VLPTSQTNAILQASVYDPTSPNAQVTFFIDGQSVGTANQAPYNLAWTPTPGTHVLRASATDVFGSFGTSPGRLFFVAPTTLPNGANWRYNDYGTNFGTSWRTLSFNDISWLRGNAPLGYNYPSQATILRSNVNSKVVISYYFRQPFSNNLAGFNYASIKLTRADGAVVYLNGQELARPDMRAGTITYTNLAVTNVPSGFGLYAGPPAVDLIPIPPATLSGLTGPNNLVAVEVHQAAPRLNEILDVTFDLALSAVAYNPGAALQLQVAGTNALLQWPDYLPDWYVEQSPDLASWSAVSNTPTPAAGSLTLQLPLQSMMFFRLRQTP